MPNLAIHKKDSDEILKFFIDAEIQDRSIEGDNLTISISRSLKNFNFLWTDDIAEPILDDKGGISGYDKKISDLKVSPTEGPQLLKVTRREKLSAMRTRHKVARLNKTQIESRIRTELIDFPENIIELFVDLALAQWAHIKLSDYYRNKK